jgi:ABC-type sugar transport system ATPase subunit
MHGDFAALKGVNFEIAPGEFFALLGPSGSGKSTTLRILAGLDAPTSGRVFIDDKDVTSVDARDRDIAMVFQSYALYPHMTVAENIAFPLEMANMAKAEIGVAVKEAARKVRIDHLLDRKPGQLSGGQQQRCALARAIVRKARLFLLDEPLSNLDAKLRLEMRTEIKRIHQTLGLTTVHVTHDQEEALSLADRLVLLREGRVQQVGTPEEVYAEPANRFVAGFMGYRNELELPVASVTDKTVVLGDLTGTRREDLGEVAVAVIRPEDFTVGDGPNAMQVDVEVVEYQGREQAIQARTAAGDPLHVRATSRLAPGDRVTVSVPPERVLVFAADSPAAPR